MFLLSFRGYLLCSFQRNWVEIPAFLFSIYGKSWISNPVISGYWSLLSIKSCTNMINCQENNKIIIDLFACVRYIPLSRNETPSSSLSHGNIVLKGGNNPFWLLPIRRMKLFIISTSTVISFKGTLYSTPISCSL